MEELLRRRISFFSGFEDGSLVFSCEAFIPHCFPVDDCVAILSDEDRVRFIFFFSSAKGRKSLLPLRVLLSRSPTSSAVPVLCLVGQLGMTGDPHQRGMLCG